MAVLSGEATIRFGVADADTEAEAEADRGRKVGEGIEILARAGDVFVLPAGTAHKTFATSPRAEFALLTPGDGHRVGNASGGDGREEEDEVGKVLEGIEVSGFTMLGAYPFEGGEWDFQRGGENVGSFETIWSVAKPEMDPVLGLDQAGLVGLWD